MHSFFVSHLNYCNSLFYGFLQFQYDRLQRVLNAAARVVCLVPKFDHITPVMRRLHWRPVRYRVMFKILLLLHKFRRSVQPALSDSLDSLLVPRTTFKTRSDRALPKRDSPRGMSLRAASGKHLAVTVFRTDLWLFTCSFWFLS